jgi:hypothetical protein
LVPDRLTRSSASTVPSEVRRFEISALVFVLFNAVAAILVLREQRSLLVYCEDWRRAAPGDPDCLEPYNYLWLEMLVAMWILGALVLGGIVGSLIVVLALHPSDDAKNGEIASKLTFGLLIIGLLLYVVRMTSLQFRVHRHLEAVSRNKAAALPTFNRDRLRGQRTGDPRSTRHRAWPDHSGAASRRSRS